MKTIDRICVAVGVGILTASSCVLYAATHPREVEFFREVQTTKTNPALVGISDSDIEKMNSQLRIIQGRSERSEIPREDLERLARVKLMQEHNGDRWDANVGFSRELPSLTTEFQDVFWQIVKWIASCAMVSSTLATWGLTGLARSRGPATPGLTSP